MPKKSYDVPIPDPVLTTGDIARYCHVGIPLVNRWIHNGDLRAFRHPGGQYRITRDNFREFLERNGMPIIEVQPRFRPQTAHGNPAPKRKRMLYYPKVCVRC